MRSLSQSGAAELSCLEDLAVWTKTLAQKLSGRDLLLLCGPMGVGKTELVRALAAELGAAEACSPTFSIHNSYPLRAGGHLEHVDLYRLESEDDLESTGFWELFAPTQGLIAVEWADRLDAKVWPLDWVMWRVELSRRGEVRELKWEQWA